MVVIVVVAVAHNGGSNASNRLAPANGSVLTSITTVSDATIASVGHGSASMLPAATTDPPLTQSGKPELLFVGGEFCPFCAAERWSLVQALSRFGTFSGLSQINSSEGDLSTFSFAKSNYTSKYLAFNGVENADQRHKGVIGEANVLTATICTMTNNRPPAPGGATDDLG